MGTVKVLSTNEELGHQEARKYHFFTNIEVPRILGCEGRGDSKLLEEVLCIEGCINY